MIAVSRSDGFDSFEAVCGSFKHYVLALRVRGVPYSESVRFPVVESYVFLYSTCATELRDQRAKWRKKKRKLAVFRISQCVPSRCLCVSQVIFEDGRREASRLWDCSVFCQRFAFCGHPAYPLRLLLF